MNKKLSKTLTKLIALLLIITLMPSGLGLAISNLRPEPAVPFDDETVSNEAPQVTLSLDQVMALPSGSVFQNGGDRLADLQNDDGGWDWPLDDGNPASASPTNTVGPISRGLAEAYVFTSHTDHLVALQDVGTFLLAKTNNFSPSDGYLAATLDEVFGGTTYTDHVWNNFYAPLANGTYDRNGAGTAYDTAGYVNLIRTNRSGAIANIAAWDIGIGLVGAASVGADTTAWINGVKAEIDELNGAGYYDVIGLAGAVYGLAYVGEDYDPTAGEHAAASNLNDLGAVLASYQISSGGFAWNSYYVIPNDGNETVQETAYAILALNMLDRAGYLSVTQAAADYIESVQLGTGGWENYPSDGENNEVTGEALWGIATAYPLNHPPTAEANGPYIVAVEQSVALDSSSSSDPDGDMLSESWMETGTTALGIVSGSTFTAGTEAGITQVTLTVDDGNGGTATDTAMVVVFDPAGGFVTGGGWIDSPEGALTTVPSLVWNQDFSTDDAGWLDNNDEWYGSIVVDNGLATFYGDSDSAPFSRFDGYRDTWPGTWIAEIDVYLDPSWPSGQGFDYSVAATGSDGNHQRDYIFHVGVVEDYGPITGRALLVNGSNNADFYTNPYKLVNDNGGNYYEVATAGWYTLQHVFRDAGGYLAVDLNLLDADGNTLWTATRENIADTIPGEVGGNRYSWFTHIDVADGIQVDNHQLFIPVSPTGKATFGFVAKYKKGASVPDGNTEFQFKAGDLNFHSTSYEWLVVTGSNFAKFKGEGTINGEGNYKFQIWAGDGSPDTFRIKIWYEDNGNEIVVYDNGMNQEIGGGSIVVHTK